MSAIEPIPIASPIAASPRSLAAMPERPSATTLDGLTAASDGRIAGGGVRTDSSIRVLLVEELDQLAARVGAMLFDHHDVQLVETVRDGRSAIGRITEVRPDVVIIDALVQGEVSGLRVARAMRETGLAMPIVFLTVPELPVILHEETGLAEVLVLPFSPEALSGAIIRLDDAFRGPVVVPPSGTIAVFSAKGGVGRTAIAHNLAVAMSRTGSVRTVLVDGDQVHGDLRLHLEAPDQAPSLLQLPTGHVTTEDMKDVLWRDATGLEVLLAPPCMEQADLINLADTRNARALLRRLFDLVVIDVPATMDEMTLSMLDDADVILDVTTPRHGAVRKAQRCHAALAAAGYPTSKILTVVNHADVGFDPRAYAAELGWPADAVLMHDERLAAGTVEPGSSIVATHPNSLFSLGFVDLAALLLARLTPPSSRPVAHAA